MVRPSIEVKNRPAPNRMLVLPGPPACPRNPATSLENTQFPTEARNRPSASEQSSMPRSRRSASDLRALDSRAERLEMSVIALREPEWFLDYAILTIPGYSPSAIHS